MRYTQECCPSAQNVYDILLLNLGCCTCARMRFHCVNVLVVLCICADAHLRGNCSDSRHWLEAGSEIPDRYTDSLLTYEPTAEQRICLRPNTEPILGNPTC